MTGPNEKALVGPAKGEFIAPPEVDEEELGRDAQATLPQQEEFWRPPTRFGSVPVEKEPQWQAQYEFPQTGKVRIACKVQDDMGGEGLWTGEIVVE